MYSIQNVKPLQRILYSEFSIYLNWYQSLTYGKLYVYIIATTPTNIIKCRIPSIVTHMKTPLNICVKIDDRLCDGYKDIHSKIKATFDCGVVLLTFESLICPQNVRFHMSASGISSSEQVLEVRNARYP